MLGRSSRQIVGARSPARSRPRRLDARVSLAPSPGCRTNHSGAFDGAVPWIAPASVRRAERFIEDNAENAIGLADVASAAGVSARSLQLAFRRFRDTTPMSRICRLSGWEIGAQGIGRSRAGRWFGHALGRERAWFRISLSRFAADYKTRFHEQPSETLRRGAVGR